MPNFIIDNVTLPYPKADATVYSGSPTNAGVAADWNTLNQDLSDIRAEFISGSWKGYQALVVAPNPSVSGSTGWMWLSSSLNPHFRVTGSSGLVDKRLLTKPTGSVSTLAGTYTTVIVDEQGVVLSGSFSAGGGGAGPDLSLSTLTASLDVLIQRNLNVYGTGTFNTLTASAGIISAMTAAMYKATQDPTANYPFLAQHVGAASNSNIWYVGNRGSDIIYLGNDSVDRVAIRAAAYGVDVLSFGQTLKYNPAAVTQAPAAAGISTNLFELNGSTVTGQTANTEAIDILLNMNRNVTIAAGNLSSLRFMQVRPPTLLFTAGASGSVVTDCATVYINGNPIASTNTTITNPWALWMSGNLRLDGTLSHGQGSVRAKVGFFNNTPVDRPGAYTLSLTGSGQRTMPPGASATSTTTTPAGWANTAAMDAWMSDYNTMRLFIKQMAQDFGAGAAGASGLGLLQ